MWLPRAAAEDALRRERSRGAAGTPAADAAAESDAAAVAVLCEVKGALRVVSVTRAAEMRGVRLGQSAADARAVAPEITTRMAAPEARAKLSAGLRRWALRFCPWTAEDVSDTTEAAVFRGDLSLALDVTGSAHLFDGEAALLKLLQQGLERWGFTAQAAVADGRGAAWALARYGAPSKRIAPSGAARAALAPLPPAALRLPTQVTEGLVRLGLDTIEAVAETPRGALTRRFGPHLVHRLDQAFGAAPDPIAPAPPPRPYTARLTLPEPIGDRASIAAGLDRLLTRLCGRLTAEGLGARGFKLSLRRVDRSEAVRSVGLAQPSRDAAAAARLFDRGLQDLDVGFGVDGLRLQAVGLERLTARQIEAEQAVAGGAICGEAGEGTGATRPKHPHDAQAAEAALSALLTAYAGRFGFDRATRLTPAQSHAPDKAALVQAAAYADPAPDWPAQAQRRPPRPLIRLAPDLITPLAPVDAGRPAPPRQFAWRGQRYETREAVGPERIAPEWWLDDPAWRSGLRDYWRVATAEGPRFWMFRTPEDPDGPRWRMAGRFA